jgi:hypothetical protein
LPHPQLPFPNLTGRSGSGSGKLSPRKSPRAVWSWHRRARSRWHGIRLPEGSMGLAASSQPLPLAPLALYRPRNVRATPLYQLLESYYEQVKASPGSRATPVAQKIC